MTLYQIKDWNEHFENNKSREREKCSFCCVPNKQDGLGYGSLLSMPDGEAMYGAFVAVVLVCSKHKQRKGWITDNGMHDGCPLTARQLSVKCRFSAETIQKMLDVISSNEVGWIVRIEKNADALPAECQPTALEGNEGKGKKEGKEFPPVLKMSERISFENELKRVCRDLDKLGSQADYERGSKAYNRVMELTARQIELRKVLGVTA